MEAASLYYSFLVASCIALIIWAWSVLNWVWLRPKRLEKHLRKQGFSGNSYKFLHGDMKEKYRMVGEAMSKPINITDDIAPRVVPFLHHSVMTHGKRSFSWDGPKPSIHIMDPQLVKEILTKIFQFPKPMSNPLIQLLAPGLVQHEGDKWVKHRKLLNPAFHMEKLKNMLPAFHSSAIEMVDAWEKMISDEGTSELDVWPYLTKMTSDVISRTSFGSSYEEGRNVFERTREQAELTLQALRSVYIPGWRFVPTKLNRRMIQVNREIRSSLRGIINRRIKEMKAGESSKNDDLLGILLESNMKEIENNGNNKKAGMSIDEVIDECKIFYFAGQESSSVLLVWTMVLLSKYQDWQQRAREEVLEVFGDKEPNYDGLSHLKTVTMILYEVLRLFPPLPVTGRTVLEETKLGDISIPPGVALTVPSILIHRDPEIWGDDAAEFKPERFSEGIAKATKNQVVSYFPFSWGPRVCIGQNFAMLEAKMALSLILQRFTFEISPSYAHAPFDLFTLEPQHGAHLILHKL